MSKAPSNSDFGDFANDASDELIADESYAQEESLAESSNQKLMGQSRKSADRPHQNNSATQMSWPKARQVDWCHGKSGECVQSPDSW